MSTMVITGRERLLQDYVRRGWEARSDAQIVAEVGATLSVPRQEPADSFVLHAPLELAARAGLLPFVHPERRLDARLRLLSLAEAYGSWGTPAPDPVVGDFESAEEAAEVLLSAIRWGDLDDVDVAARWLARASSPRALQELLAEGVAPSLAAAAHAPIFLYQLPRVAPRGEAPGELLRGLARELARHGTWRLHWIDDRQAGAPAAPEELFDALAATPSLGIPGSSFIYPLMSQVDARVAASVLGPVSGAASPELSRTVLRAAAWSMLLEPPEHAPYGWSHCLTMPQAVLGTSNAFADPSLALAIAATYVVGFRAALAQEPLVPVAPEDPGARVAEALTIGPTEAAGAVWHAPEPDDVIIAELATRAACAHDAHLVKYTLACLDAAADDRGHARLFLAAAASLVAWWAVRGDRDDTFAPAPQR